MDNIFIFVFIVFVVVLFMKAINGHDDDWPE